MKFLWVGWCKYLNHDKVYAIIELPISTNRSLSIKSFLKCWGRRGKKLQTQRVDVNPHDLASFIDSKRNKGYSTVDKEQLEKVYPEFETDLKKTSIWATLKGE